MNINSRMKKRKLTSVTAAALAAVVVIGGGKWLSLRGNADSSVMNVTLSEAAGEQCGYSYSIVPGESDEKDPKIELTNSAKAYLFVEIKDNVKCVTYSVADGWIEITDDIAPEKKPEGVRIFYRTAEPTASPQSFYVLSQNSVSYDKKLENQDLISVSAGSDILSFRAKAIEAAPFSDPSEAYEKFDDSEYTVGGIKTKKQLNDALKSVSGEGAVVCVLADDLGDDRTGDSSETFVDLSDKYSVITVNGSGYSVKFAYSSNLRYGSDNQKLILQNIYVYNAWSFASNRKAVNMDKNYCELVLENSSIGVASNILSTIITNHAALYIGGNNNTVTISSSTVKSESDSYAVYAAGSNANIVMESGTVTGKMYLKNDTTLTLNGGILVNSGLTYQKVLECSEGRIVKVYDDRGAEVRSPSKNKSYYKYVIS